MRPPFLLRLSNALDALRGKPHTHRVDAITFDVDVDTAKLEASLEKAKAQVAELAKLAEMPAPRLMLKMDRRLTQQDHELLRDAVQRHLASGKTMVFEPGMTVYQLVGGKWEPIESSGKPLSEDEARAEFMEKVFESGAMTPDEVHRLEKDRT
jgi:hypothetical protein